MMYTSVPEFKMFKMTIFTKERENKIKYYVFVKKFVDIIRIEWFIYLFYFHFVSAVSKR